MHIYITQRKQQERKFVCLKDAAQTLSLTYCCFAKFFLSDFAGNISAHQHTHVHIQRLANDVAD